MLTLGGQVEADVPVIMHGAVELAVTGLAEVEGSPAVQLLAVGVVTYLWARVGGRLWPDLCWAQGSSWPLRRCPSLPAMLSPRVPGAQEFPSTHSVPL